MIDTPPPTVSGSLHMGHVFSYTQTDIIARFQGGPNAGHTLEFDGIKHVLHTIPSGNFHPGVINLIGKLPSL